MKTVLEAVYAHFLASTALFDAVEGKMYPIVAPTGTAAPLIVVSPITEVFDRQLRHEFGTIVLEFSVYSTNFNECGALADLVVGAYNTVFLPLLGYQDYGSLELDAMYPVSQEEIFQYVVQFRLDVHKEL